MAERAATFLLLLRPWPVVGVTKVFYLQVPELGQVTAS